MFGMAIGHKLLLGGSWLNDGTISGLHYMYMLFPKYGTCTIYITFSSLFLRLMF